MSERDSERREVRRVSIAEAAEILGISKDAVRMRIRRGTLRAEKSGGKVYVLLGLKETTDQDTVHPGVRHEPNRELVDELRDRVRSLEETNREILRIIAALTQRNVDTDSLGEQAPPRELRETAKSAAERSSRAEAGPTVEDAQQPSEPPPEQEGGDLAGRWGRSTIPLVVIVVLALIGVVVFTLSYLAG